MTLFHSRCEITSTPSASIRTFRRIWKEKWSKCMRFRPRSHHAICKTCFELKRKIRSAKTFFVQVDAQLRYYEHLNSQYLDRQVYWGLREVTRRPVQCHCADIGTNMATSRCGTAIKMPKRAPWHYNGFVTMSAPRGWQICSDVGTMACH